MNTETPKKERTPFQVPAKLQDDWFSLVEACEALSVSRYVVHDLVNKGVLKRDYYGKYCIISRASVDTYLRRFTPAGK